VPIGMRGQNQFLVYRNTFAWDASQLQLATAAGALDYTKAKLFHWLHTTDGSTSRVLESVREPLERRVWFDYPGQGSPIVVGSSNQPLHVGRKLDDGKTQLHTFAYNAAGRITQTTDPAGRTLVYTYDANNIDLLAVTNTTGGRNERLATLTYN